MMVYVADVLEETESDTCEMFSTEEDSFGYCAAPTTHTIVLRTDSGAESAISVCDECGEPDRL